MIKKVDPIYHIRDYPNAKTFQQPPHKQKRGILQNKALLFTQPQPQHQN